MADTFYTIPDNPTYSIDDIRKIQDNDPVRASTVVNPVLEQMMANTQAVKNMAAGGSTAADLATQLAEAADEKANAALEAARRADQNAGIAKESAENAQVAADAALEAITKLAHTIDAVPSQNGSLTFTGSVQSPSWNSFNSETLVLGGTRTGTNAGTYTATFTPVEGYTWSDGTATARSVTWNIGRAAISTVPTQSGSVTYTGSVQSPSWSNYDSAKLTLGGTTNGTNAGSYNATFTPTANYQWSDGTTAGKTAPWSIGRAAISTVPTQSGSLTYTGSAQSPSWSNYDSAKLTLGGTTNGTNAGSYNATFTPTANYQWSDTSTAAKSVAWSVGMAAGTLTLNTTSMTLTNGALTGTIAVTRAGDGAITASSSNTSVATVSVSGTTVTVTGKVYGSATITINVAAGTNHTAPASKTCSVQVKIYSTTLNANSWAQIREVSAAGNGANYWSVGDTKAITINGAVGNYTFSNLAINAFVLGFNHNSGKEGTQRIHFQIGKIGSTDVALCDNSYDAEQTSAGYFHMNTSRTNVGGWNSSRMRSTVLGNSGTPASPPSGSLLAALPSDLRAQMQSVKKYTDNTGNGSGDVANNITATTDYLALLAEHEVFGVRNCANVYEKDSQAQYDYYKAGNSKVANKHTATSSPVWWWLRSPPNNTTNTFAAVWTGGTTNNYTASWCGGLRPCFFI